ncbi:multidrug efflux SMR transporter [Modestobacter sp. Leaf380]|uniref:DMT family transporter n=1 Tax=Modestobacter sp. Leaf380 TaxID=1736356 RepID=UPI0006F2EF29|nr:SMR family transporter [Modestobacter sp. Leaf380]KQS66697.1 cation transporter [Modestobacter sp. Leaf380]
MGAWPFLVGAITAEVTASLSLKAAQDHPGWYAAVVLGYLVSFAFFVGVLRRQMPVGVAYGIWGASGVVATALLSAAVFGEPLSALTGVGIGLVVVGVLTVEIGSQQAARAPGGTA